MADSNGRAELWRNVATAVLGFAFAAWAFVVYSSADRISSDLQEIRTEHAKIDERLDRLEQRLGAAELTLADRPPRWLIERLDRIEREVDRQQP